MAVASHICWGVVQRCGSRCIKFGAYCHASSPSYCLVSFCLWTWILQITRFKIIYCSQRCAVLISIQVSRTAAVAILMAVLWVMAPIPGYFSSIIPFFLFTLTYRVLQFLPLRWFHLLCYPFWVWLMEHPWQGDDFGHSLRCRTYWLLWVSNMQASPHPCYGRSYFNDTQLVLIGSFLLAIAIERVGCPHPSTPARPLAAHSLCARPRSHTCCKERAAQHATRTRNGHREFAAARDARTVEGTPDRERERRGKRGREGGR